MTLLLFLSYISMLVREAMIKNTWQCIRYVCVCGIVGLLVARCGAQIANETNNSLKPTTDQRNSAATTTPQRVEDVFGTAKPEDVPVAPESPTVQLDYLLTLTSKELEAAQQSTTMAQARQHAEAATNILVGHWGLWYGDADGDGHVSNLAKGNGVLPPYQTPTTANSLDPKPFPVGAALLAYQDASSEGKQAIVRDIIGDVETWNSQPRKRYEAIRQAVDAASLKNDSISKLDGGVVQAVAWTRCMVKAQSLAEAHIYAERARAALTYAVEAAKTL